MKEKKKILTLALCVCLIAVGAVGTMAYFTDSDSAVNTFTVGKVGIKLDEAKVNTDGTVTDETKRVQENKYHLIPGHTYVKDPTVTVDEDSEAAYVRMIVQVENIDELKEAIPNDGESAKYYGEDETFLLQMLCMDTGGSCTWNSEAWTYAGYTQSDDGTIGYYEFRYKDTVAKSDAPAVLPALFTHITVPGEINNDRLANLEDVKIIVNAHAIQAAGFDDADKAWAAFGN